MKITLREFFEQYQGDTLGEQEKMRIYQQFVQKSRRALSIQKFRYYAKVTSFSFSVILVLILGYLVFLPDAGYRLGYEIAQVSDAYITLEKRAGVVQADSVGEIVYTDGDLKIFKDDEQVEGGLDELGHNDRVLLQPGAVIEFTVRDGVKAKIIGPAEFAVESLGTIDGVREYAINLLAGDYLEVESIPTTEEETSESSSDNVVIKTAEFELERATSSDEMHVVISTKDDKTTIENSGDEVVIKKIVQDDEEKVLVSVKSNQVVEVDEDIALLSDEEAEKVIDQLRDRSLAIRYDVDRDQETGDDQTVADILQTNVAQQSRSVLDPDRAERLAHLLDRGQLIQQVGQTATFYYEGNESSFSIAFDNLVSRITRTYELLELDIGSSVATLDAGGGDTQQGIILIDQLIEKMTSEYYVEPVYTARLRATRNWLTTLQDTEIGAFSEEESLTYERIVQLLQEAGVETTSLQMP